MTFKQLISQYDYKDIADMVKREVELNDTDLRPMDTKLQEMEEGFAAMKAMKPSYGHIDTPIDIKEVDGRLHVSNMHLGSTSDLLSHRLDVAEGVEASPQEILAQCVFQLVAHQAATLKYRDEDDYDDLDNPQTARCLR